MIFSDQSAARALDRWFECAWQSVAPVPQVRIEFGDGNVLDTTIGGNVVTWFCLPDGRVFDVLPGVTDARHYLRSAGEAHALANQLAGLEPGRVEGVVREHLAATANGWAAHLGALLGPDHTPIAPVDLAKANAFPVRETLIDLAALEVAVSKAVLEAPLVEAVAPPRPADVLASLDADRRMIERILRPQARAVLLVDPLARPEELSAHLFRLVLKFDLDDPYLGMGSVFAPERR